MGSRAAFTDDFWAKRFRVPDSNPGKRGYRPSEVLLHISGNATYQALRRLLAIFNSWQEDPFRQDVSNCGILEALLQKVPDFLLRGRFLHYSGVQVGYSALAVNQRR